jgi:glycosyltransferase involved in cell wall biosynthesis
VTLAALPFVDLVAPVSEPLAARLPARLVAGKLAVLPCGVDVRRFAPVSRTQARSELGLSPDQRYVLFPAAPRRPEKRFDRAQAVAEGLNLLVLGNVPPAQVPLWVNAADAVVVTSERESFGLAVLEALACDVPVLSTEVGIAPEVLSRVTGTYCAPFSLPDWRLALERVLADPDPRVAGRAEAERYSADRMAQRVLEAWRRLAAR